LWSAWLEVFELLPASRLYIQNFGNRLQSLKECIALESTVERKANHELTSKD
jgi:hypothetical protein